jgi:hypothetical protein
MFQYSLHDGVFILITPHYPTIESGAHCGDSPTKPAEKHKDSQLPEKQPIIASVSAEYPATLFVAQPA